MTKQRVVVKQGNRIVADVVVKTTGIIKLASEIRKSIACEIWYEFDDRGDIMVISLI